jgi:hypothetical protein
MTKSPVNPEKEDIAYVESTDGEVTGGKHILEVVEIEKAMLYSRKTRRVRLSVAKHT